MKYVVANTQNLCDLPENQLEEFIKLARPTIVTDSGRVIVGYKHNDTIYRFAKGPLDYKMWRELFHKSPKFRSLVYSLFSTFGKSQDVESSEILNEVLTDQDGNKAPYWFLSKMLNGHTNLLSDPNVRSVLTKTLNSFIGSKGKFADTASLASTFTQVGIPANEANQMASRFDPTKNQMMTVNDAIRMLNNITPTFVPKYQDEQVEAKMEKAKSKMIALEEALNQMLPELANKNPEEKLFIKNKFINELVSTGLFNKTTAIKYIEKVAPSDKKTQPLSVQEVVKPLSRPFVGNMTETGTPYIHDYYRAFQHFIDTHPQHGPSVARSVARSIYENPSEGLPATLTEHPYPATYIKQQGDEALKKIMSENNAFIREASKNNIIADANASEDFYSLFGVGLDEATRVGRDILVENALNEFAGHHLYTKFALANEGKRHAGMAQSIMLAIEGKFRDYLNALKQAYIADRTVETRKTFPRGSYTKNFQGVIENSKYQTIAFMIERLGFRAKKHINHLSDVNSLSHHYAKLATDKLKTMGKVGMFILGSLGIAAGAHAAGMGVQPNLHSPGMFQPVNTIPAPPTPPVPPVSTAPFTGASKKKENVRVSQLDPLNSLEQQTTQEIQQILQQYGKNPQALQQAMAQLNQKVLSQIQPIYNQIREKSSITDMSPNLIDEMRSQQGFASKMEQGGMNG